MALKSMLMITCLFVTQPALAQEPHPNKFNLGATPTQEEIAAWDIDVKPSGEGLPPGEGTILKGLEIYNLKCIGCHGYEGQYGPYDQLVSWSVQVQRRTLILGMIINLDVQWVITGHMLRHFTIISKGLCLNWNQVH